MPLKRLKKVKEVEVTELERKTEAILLSDAQQLTDESFSESDNDQEEKNSNEESELSTTSFSDLGVQSWLVEALAAMAIKKPTEIQRACIPPALEGKLSCAFNTE
jgi:hypothetical protein